MSPDYYILYYQITQSLYWQFFHKDSGESRVSQGGGGSGYWCVGMKSMRKC